MLDGRSRIGPVSQDGFAVFRQVGGPLRRRSSDRTQRDQPARRRARRRRRHQRIEDPVRNVVPRQMTPAVRISPASRAALNDLASQEARDARIWPALLLPSRADKFGHRHSAAADIIQVSNLSPPCKTPICRVILPKAASASLISGRKSSQYKGLSRSLAKVGSREKMATLQRTAGRRWRRCRERQRELDAGESLHPRKARSPETGK